MMNITKYILILFETLQCLIIIASLDQSWHLFNRTLPYHGNINYRSEFAEMIRKSWNIWSNHTDSSNIRYQELEFDRAMDLIYQHQHPKVCKNVKFLLSGGYSSGFGSEIHVEGVGLAIAMEINRIYIPAKGRPYGKQWQVPYNICHGKKSLYCYYEPWTNCTHADVDLAQQLDGNQDKFFFSSEEAKIEFLSTRRISKQTIKHQENDKVLTLNHAVEEYRYLIPFQFHDFHINNAVNPIWRYYWWRGIAAAYMYTPNQHAQSLIRQYSIQSRLAPLQGQCVSMYIRHGDKGKEMKLIPFQAYAETAMMIWKLSNFTSSYGYLGTIMLGTETPQMLEEAIAWGKQHRWQILYNPIQLDIFQHKGVGYNESENRFYMTSHMNGRSANLRVHHKPVIHHPQHAHQPSPSSKQSDLLKLKHTTRKPQPHRHLSASSLNIAKEFYKEYTDMDYIMMITNLADLLQCNAFVCTLKSNYCRLLDEFRALISMKPAAYYADLSEETCRKPPCIGPADIIDFEYR